MNKYERELNNMMDTLASLTDSEFYRMSNPTFWTLRSTIGMCSRSPNLRSQSRHSLMSTRMSSREFDYQINLVLEQL